MRWYVDHPLSDALCDPLNFFVDGWVVGESRDAAIDRVEIHANGLKLGETFRLSLRPDVCRAWQLAPNTRTGFEVCCHFPNRPAQSTLQIEILIGFEGQSALQPIDARTIALSPTDSRTLPFGHVLDATFLPVVHREHVYTSGPSLPEGSAECLDLIKKFLGPAPRHILDVGCGLGYYGKHLGAAGYDWFGVEMKTSDCAELARQDLPHQRVDGRSLPFADGAYDTALCIEVVEHVEHLPDFLREVHRVAPRGLLVSVPNFEPVPYLSRQAVVPWHLLEGDHKNFFTRWSLQHLLSQFYSRVEVTCYHRMPVPSAEGLPLFYSLFASATDPR